MSSLFGFYGIGLSALRAARAGIQVTGDNISNINTPGFARRRVELVSGYPVTVRGGTLSNGVEINRIRRQQDDLVQLNVEREKGTLAGSEERLRGLRVVEELLGSVQEENLSSLYARFSQKFSELAGAPSDNALRRSAIDAADTLAQAIQTDHSRLEQQRRDEDRSVKFTVDEVNRLGEELARLNREIASSEGGNQTNAPLRDQRQRVVENLAELTGGHALQDDRGRLQFVLRGGGTLVTADSAAPLETAQQSDGTLSVSLRGEDLTGRIRDGKLGAFLGLRDDEIPDRQASIDTLAEDLITRANALTTGATDLDGNAGLPLFLPDPAPASGAAGAIAINPALTSDPRLLAVSANGAPGNGETATSLAQLRESASAALGNNSPEIFLADLTSSIGSDIAKAEVSADVSRSLVDRFELTRSGISGVSLDDEAVELIRYQRSYEASARFISVLNEITAITVNIGQ